MCWVCYIPHPPVECMCHSAKSALHECTRYTNEIVDNSRELTPSVCSSYDADCQTETITEKIGKL